MKIIYAFTAFFCSLCISLQADAQKIEGIVRGSLKDSVSGQMLYDATVSVVRTRDSALISFTITSNSGYFEVRNLSPGDYRIIVSYQGFKTMKKSFSISAGNPLLDLGTIIMDRSYTTLDEVVVTDEAPVKIKGDTLAFNASAFKTKPNAVVEDLLKKLPGVTVDRDGTVKAQGETVQKVYVDGKEFFGSDPKLATKNLGADLVSEVEVFDDMSDQAKFSRIDDGSRTKAINLKLKKEKKHGVFGQVSAGYGTDERFGANLRTNFFKGATQLSVIANGNNVNRMGFTSTDFLGMSGFNGGGMSGGGGPMVMSGRGGGMTMSMGPVSGGSMGNTSNGISTSWTAGVNYNDTWNKYFDASSGYNFNHTATDNIRNSYRKTFLGDSNINRNQDLFSKSISDVHRGNLRLNYTIDDYNSLIYSSGISVQNSSTFRLDTVTSFAEKMSGSYKLSDSRSTINNTGSGTSWNNNLLWRRKFQRAGRTLSVNFSHIFGRSDLDGYNNSSLSDYGPGGRLSDSSFNQNNRRKNNTDNYGLSFSYTEPIGRDKIWEVNYGYNYNKSESDRRTYDLNSSTGKYEVLNDELSNHFDNLNQIHRVGTNFRVIKKRYNYQLGLGMQRTSMQSNDLGSKMDFDREYTNLLTNASFNYQFARSKSLRFNYRGRTNQPSITQLQPIQDVSNPTYITEGNPGLNQEFVNNFMLSYNVFN
ncbi:MAG TPA: outer membrane beta-barrel protein, partial [Chitinophagaceae bacterium]